MPEKFNIEQTLVYVESILSLDENLVQHIYQERLPQINKILEKDRKPIDLGRSLETSSTKVKAVVYYEACQYLGIPCYKEDRCLWLILRWGASASSVEQVLRTALKTTGVVCDLDKSTGIETINWPAIESTNRNRVDRRFLSDAQFDAQIASQNHTCWGYINGSGQHIHCTAVVQRGNGNTEQGHQPEISQDLIVAQCRSCNRRQTIGDRKRGVYN